MDTKSWLLRFQNSKCFYCDRRLRRGTATLDHVQPLSQGGDNTLENLVVCCYHCNQCKGDRTIDQWLQAITQSRRLWLMHTQLGRTAPKRKPS